LLFEIPSDVAAVANDIDFLVSAETDSSFLAWLSGATGNAVDSRATVLAPTIDKQSAPTRLCENSDRPTGSARHSREGRYIVSERLNNAVVRENLVCFDSKIGALSDDATLARKNQTIHHKVLGGVEFHRSLDDKILQVRLHRFVV